MIKVGSKVIIHWFENGMKVPDLNGIVERIDGAYHDVRILDNEKYTILELYPNEMEEVQ